MYPVYQRPDPIDFQAVICRLREYGYTQRQLAELCGVTHGRIGQMAREPGADPRFTAGHALLGLLKPIDHLELTGYNRNCKK